MLRKKLITILFLLQQYIVLPQNSGGFEHQKLKGLIWSTENPVAMQNASAPLLSIGITNHFGVNNINTAHLKWMAARSNAVLALSQKYVEFSSLKQYVSECSVSKNLNKQFTGGVNFKSKLFTASEQGLESYFDADIALLWQVSGSVEFMADFRNIFGQAALFELYQCNLYSAVRIYPSRNYYLQIGCSYSNHLNEYITQINLVYFITEGISAAAGAENSIEPFYLGMEFTTPFCILSSQLKSHKYLGISSSIGIASRF